MGRRRWVMAGTAYGAQPRRATIPSAGYAGEGTSIAFTLDANNARQRRPRPRSGTRSLSNPIFSERGLGIDLFPDGVTPNDDGDADPGGAKQPAEFPRC